MSDEDVWKINTGSVQVNSRAVIDENGHQKVQWQRVEYDIDGKLVKISEWEDMYTIKYYVPQPKITFFDKVKEFFL